MKKLLSTTILLVFATSTVAFAADKKSTEQPQPGDIGNGSEAERVNVENIKEKYWARGEESELGVVQNRLYSKSRRIELGVLGGFNSTDPLLSVRALGFSLGYHFNEYLSLHGLATRYFSSSSIGSDTSAKLQSQANSALNINQPQDYFGGEVRASLLYGKLSLVGKAIIYYDLHIDAGLGETLYNAPTPAGPTGQPASSNSGSGFSESVGVGQQFYLNHHFTFNVDYRMIHYSETLVNTVIPVQNGQPAYGSPVGSRSNFNHTFVLGFSYFLDIFK